ncbi:MAG: M55 family metallopeptidase [Limnochordia bacterium]
MKFYVVTDLEGVSGVDRFNQTYGDEPFRFASMRQLTQEVNACIRGILDACPDAVIDMSDGHGSGGIIKEEMDSRANYVRGRDQTRPRYTLLSQYDAVMFVGQHAMAGMAHAPLCHTMSSKNIVYYRINNIYVGEFGFWTAIAGFQKTPVIFACGDDKLVEEAKALVPNISTVVTKWGKGWQKARHVPPEEVCAQIQSTVSAACQRIDEVAPLCFEPPYAWEVRYIYPYRTPARKIEGVRADQIDAHTMLYRSDDMIALLKVIWPQ